MAHPTNVYLLEMFSYSFWLGYPMFFTSCWMKTVGGWVVTVWQWSVKMCNYSSSGCLVWSWPLFGCFTRLSDGVWMLTSVLEFCPLFFSQLWNFASVYSTQKHLISSKDSKDSWFKQHIYNKCVKKLHTWMASQIKMITGQRLWSVRGRKSLGLIHRPVCYVTHQALGQLAMWHIKH